MKKAKTYDSVVELIDDVLEDKKFAGELKKNIYNIKRGEVEMIERLEMILHYLKNNIKKDMKKYDSN